MNERIVYALCELIGGTPLVRLGRFGKDLPGQFGSPLPSDRPGDLARRWRRGRPPGGRRGRRGGDLRRGALLEGVEPADSAVLSGASPGISSTPAHKCLAASSFNFP